MKRLWFGPFQCLVNGWKVFLDGETWTVQSTFDNEISYRGQMDSDSAIEIAESEPPKKRSDKKMKDLIPL